MFCGLQHGSHDRRTKAAATIDTHHSAWRIKKPPFESGGFCQRPGSPVQRIYGAIVTYFIEFKISFARVVDANAGISIIMTPAKRTRPMIVSSQDEKTGLK